MLDNFNLHFASNILGAVFMMVTFAIPLFNNYFRENPPALLAAWLGVGIRQSFTYYNTFIGPTFLTQNDAHFFFLVATRPSQDHPYNLMAYTKALRIFFNYLGPSEFLGNQTSIIAYAFTLFALGSILKICSIDRRMGFWAIFLSGVLPGSLIFTAVTLREAWQMMFFTWGMFFIAKICLKKNFATSYFATICCFGMLTPLHNGLVPFFGLAVLLPLVYFRVSRQALILIAILFVIPVYYLFDLKEIGLNSESNSFEALQSGRALSYIQTYQDNASEGRTAYVVPFLENGGIFTIIGLPFTFISYNLEPLPHHIQNGLDLYAMLENCLRLWLYYGIWVWWREEVDEDKRHRFILPVLFIIALEGLWGLGTSNWGTALRHHVPALPCLITFGLIMRSWHTEQQQTAPPPVEQRTPLPRKSFYRTQPQTGKSPSYKEYRAQRKDQKNDQDPT